MKTDETGGAEGQAQLLLELLCSGIRIDRRPIIVRNLANYHLNEHSSPWHDRLRSATIGQ